MPATEPTAEARREAERIIDRHVSGNEHTIEPLVRAFAAIIQARNDAEAEVAALLAVVRRLGTPEWENHGPVGGLPCRLGCGGHFRAHMLPNCPDCGHKPGCERVTKPEWFK